MELADFVESNLPRTPSRILEVGCGTGELARALAGRGHDVTAIDPQAPEGPIFRKVTLEEFAESEPFDAVVASTSLHHIHDLAAALDKIRSLLRPGGVLILNEFGWDRMDDKTAAWCASRLPVEDGPVSGSELLADWIDEHKGLHDSAAMRHALEAAFERKMFEWGPHLAGHDLERPDLIEEEGALIGSGAITAIGFRYVGTRR